MRLPDSWTGGTRLALAVRAFVVLLALAGAIFLSVWGLDLARRIGKLGAPSGPSPEQQVLALQADLGRLRTEHAKLNAAMAANAAATKAALESADKLKVATALQEQQASQIKALELENSKLKADLAANPPKLPANKKAAAAASKPVNHGLALRRFEADQPAARQLHYRLLLSQPAAAPKLVGRLQLVVTASRGGKVVVLKYPSDSKDSAKQFVVRLGQLQRFEGVLALPQGVIVKSIQARVLEKGQVRIARSVTLKDAAHVRT